MIGMHLGCSLHNWMTSYRSMAAPLSSRTLPQNSVRGKCVSNRSHNRLLSIVQQIHIRESAGNYLIFGTWNFSPSIFKHPQNRRKTCLSDTMGRADSESRAHFDLCHFQGQNQGQSTGYPKTSQNWSWPKNFPVQKGRAVNYLASANITSFLAPGSMRKSGLKDGVLRKVAKTRSN